MALDPRISLGVQPMQMPDPLAQYGKVAAIQQAQNQNALAQYQLSAAQRADEQAANRLRLFQEAGGDPVKVRNALLQTGDTEGYTKLIKGEADVGKTRAETIAKHMELSKERLAQVRTPEDYLAWHQANHSDPVLAEYFKPLGITAESQSQKIAQQLQQPGGFQALFAQSALGLDKAMEQVLTSQKLGGTERVISTPKYAMPGTTPTATVVPGSVGQVTMTPYESGTLAQGERRLSLEGRRVAVAEEEAKQKRDPEFQRRMEYSKNLGQLAAKGDYAAQQEFQKVLPQAEQAVQLVDQLIGKRDTEGKLVKGAKVHPGFRGAVGMGGWETFGIPGIAQLTPGSDAADFKAMYDQVTSGAFLQAFNSLRGAGAITEKEGEKATSAITRMKLSQSEPEFIKAAMEYQDVIRKGVAKAQSRATGAGGAAPVSPATPGVIDFGSLR